MNVDFSKVKKSPVPASAEPGTLAWYRGDGIKVGVYAEAIRVYDKDDNLLAAVATTTSTPTTAEVKDAARKALANAERASDWGTTRENVSLATPKVRIDQSRAEPAFRDAFSFLTSGRSVLA